MMRYADFYTIIKRKSVARLAFLTKNCELCTLIDKFVFICVELLVI